MSEPVTIPHNELGQPDLQALVAQCGGYNKITPELWAAWDRANEEYQERRRRMRPPVDEFIAQSPKPQPTPYEFCATCNQEAHFGYRDAETGELVWFCGKHRLAQWWADARR
jgi:hypothetical protein